MKKAIFKVLPLLRVLLEIILSAIKLSKRKKAKRNR